MELQTVFKELAAAEDKGLSEEQRKELEEKAAAKGMVALFKVSDTQKTFVSLFV
jgi:hypothetical protein